MPEDATGEGFGAQTKFHSVQASARVGDVTGSCRNDLRPQMPLRQESWQGRAGGGLTEQEGFRWNHAAQPSSSSVHVPRAHGAKGQGRQEYAAACPNVFGRIDGLGRGMTEPRDARRAARALRHERALLAGRQAHRELVEEAEQCASQQENVQQFAERLRALGFSDQKGDQYELPGGGQAVMVDLMVLREAKEAATDIWQAIRDAVAVAVRHAEARVNESWESAWAEQKRQLRAERSRARVLGERMRSARALGRRAQALASPCWEACKPVLAEAKCSETPSSWASVMPLVNAVDGLAHEAAALSDRAQEVFESVAKVEGETETVAPSSFPPSCTEWQEWEAEACYRPVGAPRQEWIGWWRAGALVERLPTQSAVVLQAAVRGCTVRTRMRRRVAGRGEVGGGDEGDSDDEYASAEEEAGAVERDGEGGSAAEARGGGRSELTERPDRGKAEEGGGSSPGAGVGGMKRWSCPWCSWSDDVGRTPLAITTPGASGVLRCPNCGKG